MNPKNLKFLLIDDWRIIAINVKTQSLYYVDTEAWPEWGDAPIFPVRELNSVAKYMLPVAFKKWESLPWKFFGKPDFNLSRFCYLR